MSDIAPTAALLSGTAPQAVSQGVPATVSNPPPALARAAAGSVLRGTVTGHDDQGRALLRTSQGSLTLVTKTPLPAGAQVTLQVRAAGAQLQVAILQVDGRPVAAPAPASAPGALPGTNQGTPQSAAQGAAANPTPAGGQAAPAALPPGPHPGAAQGTPRGAAPAVPPSGSPAAPAGSGATAPASSLAVEDVLALGQRVRAVVQSAPRAALPSAPGGPQAQHAVAQALRPGSELLVRILRVEPPATPPQTTAANAQTPAADTAVTGTAAAITATAPATSQAAPFQAAPSQAAVLPAAQAARAALAEARPEAPGRATAGNPLPAPSPRAGPAAPQGTPQAAVSRPATVIGQPPAPHQPAGTATAAVRTAPTAPPGPLAAPAAPDGLSAARTAAATPAGAAAPAPTAAPASASSVTPSVAPSTANTGTADTGAANLLPATVGETSGSAAPGRTLVSTPLRTLALETGARLPPGTRLAIEIVGRLPLPPEPAARPDTHTFLRDWTVLEAALRSVVEAAPPGQAEAALPPGLPQPGPRLASGLLFFLSALASGDVAAWIGQKSLDVLNARGRGDLIAGLTRDFARIGRLADAVGGDWRFVPLPLFDGQQVQPLRFFFRRGRGQGRDSETREAATRFIVEVELTRLGDLQLDGLVRARHFDLILRSRGALPQPMRRDIAAIFQSANEISGSDGQIAFQAGRGWDFLPLDRDLQSRGAEAAGALLV